MLYCVISAVLRGSCLLVIVTACNLLRSVNDQLNEDYYYCLVSTTAGGEETRKILRVTVEPPDPSNLDQEKAVERIKLEIVEDLPSPTNDEDMQVLW